MNKQVTAQKPGGFNRVLNFIKVAGNKLPEPAMLFALLLALVWALSLSAGGSTGLQPHETAVDMNNANLQGLAFLFGAPGRAH